MASVAPSRYVALTRQQALDIVSSLRMLVGCSPVKLRIGAVISLPYEVYKGGRYYTFDQQPFKIIRKLTWQEYRDAVPPELRSTIRTTGFFYEIHTD